jgi:hypothetical protein
VLDPRGSSKEIVVTTVPEVSAHELTDAQRAFADSHRALPGFRAELSDAVFLYERGAGRTTRWLVDAAGLIVATKSFASVR